MTAVIDWGDVHAGNPAVDLAIGHGFLPPAARSRFRAAYGAIGEDAWAFARVRALGYAVALMVYGDDVGDPGMLQEGRIGLSQVLAED